MNKQEMINTKPSNATLTPKHVFGLRTEVQNCVQFFSNDKCAYLAGYYGVICMTKRNAQYFVPAVTDYGEITSFAVDESNDSILFFMSQQAEGRIYLIFRYINKTLFNIESAKTKTFYYNEPKDYIYASALNFQSGLLACITGVSSPILVLIYSLESKFNPKCVARVNMKSVCQYTNININKHNSDLLSLWGDSCLAILYMKDLEKPLEVNASTFAEFSSCPFNIISSVWLNSTTVAFLNDSCDILIIDVTNRYKLDSLAHRKLIKWNTLFDFPPKGISIFEKNSCLFVVRNDGYIIKLDNKGFKDDLKYEKSTASSKPVINIPQMDIKCLTTSKIIDASQNFGVLMATSNGQLFYLDLSNDNAICDGSNYKPFLCPFHSDDIISLHVSKWKQLVATCSKDKSVRIWNYVNLQLEAMKIFEEDIFQVSFHPNGLHLAILFSGRFELFDILENTLKPFKEIRTYNAKHIQFSSFGTMISVCAKTAFQIYNFYTRRKIFDSKDLCNKTKGLIGHTDDIRSLTWDIDDTGFTTCGNDGRVIYWNLSSMTQPIVYRKENTKYKLTEIMTLEDYISKRIFALDDKGLIEICHALPSKDYMDSSGNNKDSLTYDKESLVLQSKLIQEGNYSSMLFDQELKLLITSSPTDKTCSLNIIDYSKFSAGLTQKDIGSFPANSKGVNVIKASMDMTHIFSGGNDRCLFFFNLINVSKSADKRDIEIHEPENLILIPKEDLDRNGAELRAELNTKDAEILREEEDFKADLEKYARDLDEQNRIYESTLKEFAKQKAELDIQIKTQKEYFENDLLTLKIEFDGKTNTLGADHNKSITAKEEDKERENKILKEEKAKNEKNLKMLKEKILKDERNLEDAQKKEIEELNTKIKDLENEKKEIETEIITKKEVLMTENDIHITEKRRELDKLKKYYEKTKNEHKEQEDKLKIEIDSIRHKNKDIEQKLNDGNKELQTLKQENLKLEKQIRDMKTDRLEKEETIKDKNALKRKLDKDNQELEKFKYVLHYKIKELKHNKEPKERKIQQMEKKAKDMEREIKSCELGQATIIIELSTNHQIIKIHEDQISKTEKRIEELRKYKKLFQENLYNSMKRARNHKDCKKEVVLLKRNFLDKEKIENVEKPFESNYERQREFLEENVDHYKNKINKLNDLFANDHNKVMKEKRQLIDIVNQLEKEKKEIGDNEFYNRDNISSITKPKGKLKPEVPKFSLMKKEDSSSDEVILKNLSNELKEIEKEIQLIRYWSNKKKIDEKMKEKKNRNQEEENEYGY